MPGGKQYCDPSYIYIIESSFPTHYITPVTYAIEFQPRSEHRSMEQSFVTVGCDVGSGEGKYVKSLEKE